MTKLNIALATALCAFPGAAANALPITIGYSFAPATSAAGITTVATSGPGATDAFAAGNTAGGAFRILVTASDQSTPSAFSLATFTITTKSLIGPGTIYIYASETNITPDRGLFLSGFGVDSLSAVGAVETTYAGSNVAYAMDHQLATYTLVPGAGAPNDAMLSPGLPDPFAVTQVFKIRFTGAGQNFVGSQTLQNILPEPVSLGVLGVSLIAVGFSRRVRR